MIKQDFNEAADAYRKVRETIGALKEEHAQVSTQIEEAEAELKVLPLAPLPFEDLKEAILEYIDASGERYAERHVKPALIELATSFAGGTPIHGIGKPISFAEIDGAITGADSYLSHVHIAHKAQSSFNDLALNYFVGQLVREGLRKLMDRMTPEDFGYDKIHPDKVGSSRRERRVSIAALADRIAQLKAHKGDLAIRLAQLGAPVGMVLRK
jgi:hypothetical protein